MEDNTIKKIVKTNLCTNCGACYAVCSEDAIDMRLNDRKGIFEPTIDEDLCTHCGKCLEVCCGKGYNFKEFYRKIFDDIPMDPWLGIYKELLTSNATDKELRFNSSSGGSLTALLLFLIERKIVDGAIVTRFSRNDPLMPEVIIAKTRKDIMESIGSKYCPVPANIALKEVARIPGKYAFVGLPCHIHSLRIMMDKYAIYRERIILILGLMCSHTNTFNGTKYYLLQQGIKLNDIKAFGYRGNGWLGSISVTKRNNSIKKFERNPQNIKEKNLLSTSFNYGFTLSRCLTCCDHLAEFADIVFGDPRLPEYVTNEHIGKSLVIIRTDFANALYQKAITEGYVKNDIILSRKDFYRGQNLSFKKGFKSHLIFNRFTFKTNPKYVFSKQKDSKFSLERIIKYMPSYFPAKNLYTRFTYNYVLLFNNVLNRKKLIGYISRLIRRR